MSRFLLFATFSLIAAAASYGQPLPILDTVEKRYKTETSFGMVEVQALQTGEALPFWMRSLQNGSIPLSGTSLSAIGTYVRDYDRDTIRKVDWGVGIQMRTNLGKIAEALLIEAYAKVKWNMFELKAGRSRDVFGLMDTTLGSGSFTVSGNAAGIPKIGISIPEYSFPIFDSLLAFKGNFVQGWMGNSPINVTNNVKQLTSYYHQKSLHMRIGKPGWKVRGIAGVVHQAYWVNGNDMWGSSYTLTPFQTYTYVLTGKNYIYKPNSAFTTNVGNHQGSIDFGLEINGDKVNTLLYHQVLYESENSFKHGSLSDGLTGVSITNKQPADGGFYFRKLVLEYFRTVDQAYVSSRPYNYDNYYNHEFFINGSSYLGNAMGNPFISRKSDMREELPKGGGRNFFSNNRLTLFHIGAEAAVDNLMLKARFSVSKNLGLYETNGRFPTVSQRSISIEAGLPLKDGWQVRSLFALDNGALLNNATGGFISLARVF